ncbi:hypothetical protein R1sor_011616 [Riccia sorocarpa]|uniref:Uncharacterized protein n=1 Tax=Riccia sorocarpa TaxID=122646 RepID=A0ABD3I516_9MARC
MGSKGAASKQTEDSAQSGGIVVAGENEVEGQKTFGCYSREIEKFEWEDEERANYWLKQFGAFPAMKLTYMHPAFIADLVNAYNPISDRITLSKYHYVLSDDMISDVFQIPNEGIAVSKYLVIPHEWIEFCYPEYAIPEKGRKEYFTAVCCEDLEWRAKINWVLRYVLGRAEGREISKGVLAAMIQAEEEGQTVNWAVVITERLRGELKRLKGIRKGDFLRTEAGPQLTMVVEYILTERDKGPSTKPAKDVAKLPTVSDITPSTRTRASKRKEIGSTTVVPKKKERKTYTRRKLVTTANSDSERSDSRGTATTSNPTPRRAITPESNPVITTPNPYLVIKNRQDTIAPGDGASISAGSGQVTTASTIQTTPPPAMDLSTSSSPAQKEKEPIVELQERSLKAATRAEQIRDLESILRDTVTPDIQAAADEATAAAQDFVLHHQLRNQARTTTISSTSTKVIPTESTTLTIAVVKNPLFGGDTSVSAAVQLAEGLTHVVTSGSEAPELLTVHSVSEPIDQTSKTREEFIQPALVDSTSPPEAVAVATGVDQETRVTIIELEDQSSPEKDPVVKQQSPDGQTEGKVIEDHQQVSASDPVRKSPVRVMPEPLPVGAESGETYRKE